jgi:hypothetical protein
VAAAGAIPVIGAMTARRRRTAMLRQRFGSEYDRTVEAHENQREAEAELREREREDQLLRDRYRPFIAARSGRQPPGGAGQCLRRPR